MCIAENELSALIRARYALIYVVAAEELHVEASLAKIAKERNMDVRYWGVSRGLVDRDGEVVEGVTDPIGILSHIYDTKARTLFVLRDYNAFLEDAVVRRWLRDLGSALRASPAERERCIVILAPSLKLPVDLEKEIAVVDYPLPDKKKLAGIVRGLTAQIPEEKRAAVFADSEEAIVEAATGLTATEAENVLAKTLVVEKKLSVKPILGAKKEVIRKSGILEYLEPEHTLDDVAGLEVLKEWLGKRRRAFTQEARDFGIDTPKGCLFIGPPGTGKSLCSRALASAWKMPLVRLDVGRLMGSLVGETEAAMRQVIKTIEGLGPVVVQIEEIEKAFAGSGTDSSGVTTRMMGSLLTWLQEKKSPSFIAVTANDISGLPPELTRSGRFDAIWLVDLPNRKERAACFAVHLRRRKRNPDKFDLGQLAEHSLNMSGAEIEASVVEALHHAFDEERELEMKDLYAAVENMTPLAVTYKEKIDYLRNWAKGRARIASLPDAPSPTQVPRRIDVDLDN